MAKSLIEDLKEYWALLFVIIGILVSLLLATTPTRDLRTLESNPNFYLQLATVVEVEDKGTVVVEDSTGNLWAFDRSILTFYHCGDVATMIMDSCGTEDVVDDVIVRVRK